MARWTYRCYDDGKEPCLWQRWYDENPSVQGSHDSVFEILETREAWQDEVHTKRLSQGKGLIEVRFKGQDKRHWRVFGFYQKGIRQQFVVVAIGYHKKQNYTPKKVIKTAIKRMTEIEDGKAKALSCERPD